MTAGVAFLRLALAFELGLAGVAFLLGWPFGINPWRDLDPTLRGLALGTFATVPMAVGLVLCDIGSFGPLRRIRAILDRHILPLLRGRSVTQLALVALAAGLGEETLFRGLLQGGLNEWIGPGPALAIASVVFGLVHAVTIAYAVIAGLIGAYLGAVYWFTGDLTIPVVAHGLYDLIALIYFLRTSRGDTIGPSEHPPEVSSR